MLIRQQFCILVLENALAHRGLESVLNRPTISLLNNDKSNPLLFP